MFGRRRSPSPEPSDHPGLGIGALVQVVDTDRGGERWAGEPIGVIVAPGGNQHVGLPGVGEPLSWTVAFDDAVYTKDGRGPFERATVLSRQLVPIQPAPDTEA
ncbi:hypothetical protein GCM10017714_09120 [Curtobacterium pusillum]|uniref:Uncharacterized protein n=1 Tax=Curtobacterium pusillum TaxID=69373 RepID=A0ABX2M518_9MICO|nr:hypothetical protein [Curtobacterium pusillum]NUU12588.1 hypothetical protein [Curtobacterium pusillum]GLK30174.1 hypothetical protein GCM10017610_04590 [Curtobacterium pusillum]